jgi:hypothetical protein
VLSCRALASLCQLLMGRASVVSAGGLVAFAAALQDTPEAAALALKVCAGALLQQPAPTPSCIHGFADPKSLACIKYYGRTLLCQHTWPTCIP